MKRIPTLLLALLMLVSLSGCWQEDHEKAEEDLWPVEQPEKEEDPQKDSTLPSVFSLPYLAGQTLDPITCPEGMQQVIASLICEGLFRLDAQFQPQPLLCNTYTHDETARVYHLTLREDVTFSDGSPLTPSDVRASLLRAKNSVRYGSRLSEMQSIAVKGNTVTITLSQPNFHFISLLDVPIVKLSGENSAVLGTGPYLFTELDGLPCLVASQNWWQSGKQPVERIVLAETSDQDAVLYRFNSHDVQLMVTDLTGTSSANASGRFDCWNADTTVMQYLGCNTAKAPLDNAAFRRSLSLGINRQYLVNAYLSGHGRAAQFPVSPVSLLYPGSLEQEYSPENFSAALADSGYAPERTLTLLVNAENSFKVSSAAYLASAFTAAGVPMEVRTLPWEEYLAALAAGNYDLYYGEVKLQADWDLTVLLSTGGSLNYSRGSDPALDQLLLDYRSAEDPTAAMKALCRQAADDAFLLPICFKSISVLTQADVVEGLTPTATEPFYDLTSCTIQLKSA